MCVMSGIAITSRADLQTFREYPDHHSVLMRTHDALRLYQALQAFQANHRV